MFERLEFLRDKANRLPMRPGVYIMKDKGGKIIYIGKAKLLASSEEFEKVKDEAITLVKYINDMEINEIVKAIKKITEYKFDVNDYLDILSVWYRDVLLYKATKDINSLIFKDELQQIRRVADRSTYEGIETIVNALQQAKRRLEANVNFDLTMELLLLTIKEN